MERKDGRQLKQKQITLPEWVLHTQAAQSRVSKSSVYSVRTGYLEGNPRCG